MLVEIKIDHTCPHRDRDRHGSADADGDGDGGSGSDDARTMRRRSWFMLGGIKRNAQAFKAYAYETDETGQTVPAATCRAGKASRTAALMDLRLPSLPKLGRSKEGNHSDLEMMAASERGQSKKGVPASETAPADDDDDDFDVDCLVDIEVQRRGGHQLLTDEGDVAAGGPDGCDLEDVEVDPLHPSQLQCRSAGLGLGYEAANGSTSKFSRKQHRKQHKREQARREQRTSIRGQALGSRQSAERRETHFEQCLRSRPTIKSGVICLLTSFLSTAGILTTLAGSRQGAGAHDGFATSSGQELFAMRLLGRLPPPEQPMPLPPTLSACRMIGWPCSPRLAFRALAFPGPIQQCRRTHRRRLCSRKRFSTLYTTFTPICSASLAIPSEQMRLSLWVGRSTRSRTPAATAGSDAAEAARARAFAGT
jgi:hypothetical protein